jgi:hypothetical protein
MHRWTHTWCSQHHPSPPVLTFLIIDPRFLVHCPALLICTHSNCSPCRQAVRALECRSSANSATVAEQEAVLQRMSKDLATLQRSHAALLTTLPPSDGAPVPADVRSHFDGLRHAQRSWEDRMSGLLDAVSALQSPSRRGGGRSAPGGAARIQP